MKIKGVHEEEVKRFIEKTYQLRIFSIAYHPHGENGASYFLETDKGKFYAKVFAKSSEIYKSIRAIKIFIEFLYRIKDEDNFDYISVPIKNKNGNLISKFKGFPLVIEDFISGKNPKKLLEKDYEEVGEIIGKFQNINPKKFTKIKKDILDIKWESKILRLLNKYKKKKPTAGGEKELLKILQRKKEILESAVNFLRKNVSKIRKREKEYVVVHEDLHKLNLLKTKDKIYLIDWEGLRLALPERDLIWFRKGLGLNPFFKKQYEKFKKNKYKVNSEIMKFYVVKRLLSDTTYFSQQVIDRQESYRESRGYIKEIQSEIQELEETLKL
ncbi:MAG: phosphotransferase [Nanoarchaeota archaeon]|nr:phosphotransferase [Nanoarchaeota archaeon]MBU1946964.1 phosphotransferase [Nanoarchaeota archaeon]